MSRQISDESKSRQGRGTGIGASYKPWILCSEFNSMGTATSIPDWIHGRMIQCLSQAERWFYYKLRWNDDVVDIREQYPLLPLSETAGIASGFGVKGSFNNNKVMTTDFIITLKNGANMALTIKAGRKDVSSRVLELLNIEREYWRRRGVEYFIGYKEDLNPEEILNIRDVVACYDRKDIYDDFSLVRHLIATKRVLVDMSKRIEYLNLINELKEKEEWKKVKSELGCSWN